MSEGKSGPRPLVAGNWKMNGLKVALPEVLALKETLGGPLAKIEADVMIAPPTSLLMVMAEAARGGRVAFSGQDCHVKASGAHTGDISAEMLRDAGATAVIVGHSERRSDHGETDKIVREKALAAHRAALTAIICIGETAGERQAGLTLQVVARQLKGSIPDNVSAANTVVAYEPVWAIGTGLTATPQDVAEVHAAIRHDLTQRFGETGHQIRILYGGSVKPDNAKSLMSVANVNGALVGGASLKASDFIAIIRAYER